MLLSIGALIVVGCLILSVNVYLESMAFGRFRLGYGLLGPTKIRLFGNLRELAKEEPSAPRS